METKNGAAAAELRDALMDNDPVAALDRAFTDPRTGLADAFPEIPALAALSETAGGELHKDNYRHTLRVVAQCGADADVATRLAALCHDIGKPACRKIDGTEVTFHGHETVGAKIARRRLTELGFAAHVVDEAVEIMVCAAKAQSYLTEWTDAAVRRVKRQAGPLWPQVLTLARADCTTRHDHKRFALWALMDELEQRAADIEAADARAAERPVLNGDDLAELGVARGPEMGRVLRWLLERNRAGELLDADEARAAILER